MKKLLFAILMLFILASPTYAQVSEIAEVTATVQSTLSLTKDADVVFGNISATGTPTLDPKDVNHTDVGSTAHAGQFTISGGAGTGVVISYGSSYTLGDGGSNTLTFTPDVEGHATTQANASTISDGSNVTLDGSGAYIVWIGGSLGTLSNQAVGAYSTSAANGGGNFTLTIDYL